MLYVDGKTTDVDIVVSVQFSVDIQFDHGTVSSCFSMVSPGVRDEDADETAWAAECSIERGSRHG